MIKPEIEAIFAYNNTSADAALRSFILTGAGNLPELLAGYTDLQAFKKTSGQINHLNPDSPLISEAYWIGSPITPVLTDHELLLKHYRGHYPDIYIDAINNTLPHNFVLHHNSMVTWMGISQTKDAAQWLKLVNYCWVRGGIVTQITGEAITLNSFKLSATPQGNFNLVYLPQSVSWDKDLISNFQLGQFIATHRGTAITEISYLQLKQLLTWTNKIVKQL